MFTVESKEENRAESFSAAALPTRHEILGECRSPIFSILLYSDSAFLLVSLLLSDRHAGETAEALLLLGYKLLLFEKILS